MRLTARAWLPIRWAAGLLGRRRSVLGFLGLTRAARGGGGMSAARVGLVVAATLAPGSVPLGGYRPGERIALLLGSEGPGLSEAWQQAADDRVSIEMTDRVDSLNVATAAAILGYALR